MDRSMPGTKYLLSLSFALLLFGLSFTLIADYDFWWHLNLGRAIFESGTFNIHDSFTYTFQGAPQFNGEWLSDLALFAVYHLGGFFGINLFKFLLLVLTFALLFRVGMNMCPGNERYREWLLATVISLAVIAFSIRFRLFVRPYLFSYLFLALSLFLLTSYKKSNSIRFLYLFPLMEIFWANTSKGLFFGPLILALYILSDLSDRKFDKRLVATFIATLLASLISPEGINPYLQLISFASQGQSAPVVGEHQPLSTQILWGGGFDYTWAFQLLTAGALFYFAVLGGWRNRFHLLTFVVFLIPAIRAVRMIDFFSLTAILFFLPTVAKPIGFLTGRYEILKRLSPPILSVLVILATLFTVPGNRSYSFGYGPKEKNTPSGAMAFLEREEINGRIFNSYPYGGFLPWVDPQRLVYIDGRVNQLFPPEFHERYFQVINDPQAWDEEDKRWGFDVAILEYDLKDSGRHFPRHINQNPNWALVYWDDRSAVYLKRTPLLEEPIARHEYLVAKPNFYGFDYLLNRMKELGKSEVLTQLQNEISRAPSNQEIRLAKVFVLQQLNFRGVKNEAILQELDLCLTLPPEISQEHSARAFILNRMGRKDEAAAEIERALSLNPGDPLALHLSNGSTKSKTKWKGH